MLKEFFMVQHKKILKKLMDRLQRRQDKMNSQIYVQDLVATQVNDKDASDHHGVNSMQVV